MRIGTQIFFITILFSQLFLSEIKAFSSDSEFEKNFEEGFNDQPLARKIDHPDWFKESFLDLRDDLEEALQNGKQGVALYFGQKNCAYCKALLDVNFKKPDIEKYVRDNYDVIALDIWGSRIVTLFDGSSVTESELAVFENTNFTPSLIFFDENGNMAYKMRGYYKPYRFQAMMKYIVEDFYKTESFRDYLERANPPPRFAIEDLNEHELFTKGPVILDRRGAYGAKPLAVIFEQKQCHACDQLHSEPLNNEQTKKWLKGFEIRQLDAWSNTPVITPDGAKLTAQQWAKQLNINYFPTTVFFNEYGSEILRVDSVVKLYRMRSILGFILTNGYKNFKTFQHWRRYTELPR